MGLRVWRPIHRTSVCRPNSRLLINSTTDEQCARLTIENLETFRILDDRWMLGCASCPSHHRESA